MRGGFTVQNVPKIISSRRSPIRKQLSAAKSADHPAPRPAHEEEEVKPMVVASTKFCGILQASARTNQVNKASRFEAALYNIVAVVQIWKFLGLLDPSIKSKII